MGSRGLNGIDTQSTLQPLPIITATEALQCLNPDEAVRTGHDGAVEVTARDQWAKVKDPTGLPNSSYHTVLSASSYADSQINSQPERLPNPPQSKDWEDHRLETTQKYGNKLKGLDLSEYCKVLAETYREFQKDLLSLKYDLEMNCH